jgi:hypothetical protein
VELAVLAQQMPIAELARLQVPDAHPLDASEFGGWASPAAGVS